MSPFDLIISVVLVMASGALAPGPVVFATVLEGSRHGTRAGMMFSIAHALVEFPLVTLLALGLVSLNQQVIKVVVGILGGIACSSSASRRPEAPLGPYRPSKGRIGRTRAASSSRAWRSTL